MCFPRAGGDVPARPPQTSLRTGFSPCRRGCSAMQRAAGTLAGVFPVQAGMFRPAPGPRPGRPGFPRAGGDVPRLDLLEQCFRKFSPCRRGCSARAAMVNSSLDVFPVQAGMFRRASLAACATSCFPRAGGDVPRLIAGLNSTIEFSPCRRGCSDRWELMQRVDVVFPVQAGMFRTDR